MSDSRDLVPYGPSIMLLRSLSFRESFDPERFAEVAMDCAVDHANLIRPSGSVAALTATAVRSICERNTVLVGLDKGLQKRLRNGSVKWATKGGGKTADLVATTGSRFAGKATQVGGLASISGIAATGVVAIVEIAHLIADADMARMQRETIEKLSKLEAYHDIAQEAKLEQLYFQARTILSEPVDRHVQSRILEVRSQLHELRIQWRREAEHNLKAIKDSRNSGWLSNVRSGQEGRDLKTEERIKAELKKFILIDYALRLDHVVGIASGTWEKTTKTTEDELEEIERLATTLRDKCFYISDKRRENVMLIQNSLEDIPSYYTQLLNRVPPANEETLLLEFDDSKAS